MRTPRWLRYGLLAASVAGSAAASPAPEVTAAFRELSELRTTEALQRFRDLAEEERSDSDEIQLGLALTLLAAQPRTPARLGEARQGLDRLAAEASDPEVRLSARYHLIRLQEWQRSPGEPVGEIIAAYTALHAAYPAEPYGQMAAVRAAIVDLFAQAGDDPTVRSAHEHWAEVSRSLASDSIRSSLELILADAAADLLQDDRLNRRHLLEVEALNVATPQTLRRVRVRLIMTALALGEHAEVQRRLAAFAELHPHEPVLPQMQALIRVSQEARP